MHAPMGYAGYGRNIEGGGGQRGMATSNAAPRDTWRMKGEGLEEGGRVVIRQETETAP